jgi:L-cysteine/cystine lyase
MTFDEARALFPVLARFAYLNAGTLGPLSRPTLAAMEERLRFDQEQGRGGHGWFMSVLELRARVREQLAALIGSSKAQVALTSSTTDGCNIVLSGLKLRPDDEVVTTDSEHPGLFGGLAASGAALRVVEVRDLPTAEILDALDAAITDRTRLIALSHVSWLTGAVLPVAELAGRGAPLLVDGAQAAGAIPVDVEELGCDFYTVSAQKWLLGPDVTGALYVRPERVEELRMTFPSYGSWDWEAEVRYTPKNGAGRFDPGWIPLGSVAGLLQSLAFAEEAGIERFDHARAQAERLRGLLAERYEVITEPGQATIVTWKAEGESADVVGRLAEAGVIVRDLRGFGWLRASCGFWTSDEDLDRLLEAL